MPRAVTLTRAKQQAPKLQTPSNKRKTAEAEQLRNASPGGGGLLDRLPRLALHGDLAAVVVRCVMLGGFGAYGGQVRSALGGLRLCK